MSVLKIFALFSSSLVILGLIVFIYKLIKQQDRLWIGYGTSIVSTILYFTGAFLFSVDENSSSSNPPFDVFVNEILPIILFFLGILGLILGLIVFIYKLIKQKDKLWIGCLTVIASTLLCSFGGILISALGTSSSGNQTSNITPTKQTKVTVEVTRIVTLEVTKIIEKPVTVTPSLIPSITLTPSISPTITLTPSPTIPPSKTPTPLPTKSYGELADITARMLACRSIYSDDAGRWLPLYDHFLYREENSYNISNQGFITIDCQGSHGNACAEYNGYFVANNEIVYGNNEMYIWYIERNLSKVYSVNGNAIGLTKNFERFSPNKGLFPPNIINYMEEQFRNPDFVKGTIPRPLTYFKEECN
jgi:hypothetical protein